jgi:hypothetical protein
LKVSKSLLNYPVNVAAEAFAEFLFLFVVFYTVLGSVRLLLEAGEVKRARELAQMLPSPPIELTFVETAQMALGALNDDMQGTPAIEVSVALWCIEAVASCRALAPSNTWNFRENSGIMWKYNLVNNSRAIFDEAFFIQVCRNCFY